MRNPNGQSDWVLAARFVGTDAAVQGDVRRIAPIGNLAWQPLPADRTAAFWSVVARGSQGVPRWLNQAAHQAMRRWRNWTARSPPKGTVPSSSLGRRT